MIGGRDAVAPPVGTQPGNSRAIPTCGKVGRAVPSEPQNGRNTHAPARGSPGTARPTIHGALKTGRRRLAGDGSPWYPLPPSRLSIAAIGHAPRDECPPASRSSRSTRRRKRSPGDRRPISRVRVPFVSIPIAIAIPIAIYCPQRLGSGASYCESPAPVGLIVPRSLSRSRTRTPYPYTTSPSRPLRGRSLGTGKLLLQSRGRQPGRPSAQ